MLKYRENAIIRMSTVFACFVMLILSTTFIGVGADGLARKKQEKDSYVAAGCSITQCKWLNKSACTCKDCIEAPCSYYNLSLTCSSHCNEYQEIQNLIVEFENGFDCTYKELEGFYSCSNPQGSFSLYSENIFLGGWICLVVIFSLIFAINLCLLAVCIWPSATQYQPL